MKENYEKVKNLIKAMGKDLVIVAATKTQDPQTINQLIKLGVNNIGENKVQELLKKYDFILKEYNGTKTVFHFIGTLQTNKVKYIIDKVDLIQSVTSVKLLNEINKQAEKINKVQDVLIEVNIADEETKTGADLNELDAIINHAKELKNIKVQGLMCMIPLLSDDNEKKRLFSKMFGLFIDNKFKNIDNVNMNILSMGMSNDFIQAIENGSNMIRLGTSLFGKRITEE